MVTTNPTRWNLRATYTLEVEVYEAPDVQGLLGGYWVRPDTVRISYDYPGAGLWDRRAHVIGRNVKQDGSLGATRKVEFSMGTDTWPEWLVEVASAHEPDWSNMLPADSGRIGTVP